MTNSEKNEALTIIKKYQSINNKLEKILDSLQIMNEKKDKAMRELEDLKKRESEFIVSYQEKYGSTGNILKDLQGQ